MANLITKEKSLINKEPKSIFFLISVLILTAPILSKLFSEIFKTQFIYFLYFLLLSNVLFITIFCLPFFSKYKFPFKKINYTTLSKEGILVICFLLAFLAWATISVVFSSNIKISLFDLPNVTRHEGLIMYYIYALFVVCGFFIRKENSRKYIVLILLFMSTFIGIIDILNALNLIKSTYILKYCGFWNNQNHFGYFLTICILISGSTFVLEKTKWLRIYSLISFIFLNAVLFMNDTLGCELAVVVTLIFATVFLILRDKRNWKLCILLWLAYITTIVIDCLLHDFGFQSITFIEEIKGLFIDTTLITKTPSSTESAMAGTGRWGLWLETFKNMKEKPIFGIGINCQLIENPNLSSSRPHNELLQFGSTMGIPSLIFYMGYIITLLVILIKQRKTLTNYTFIFMMAVFAYLVSSMFGVSLPYTFSAYAVILGLVLGGINYNKPIKLEIKETNDNKKAFKN